jgi:small-conductance mechanosensitive channel
VPDRNGSLVEFINPGAAPLVLVIVVGAVLLVRVSHRIMAQVSERWTQRRLTIKQVDTLVAFFVYIVAAILATTSLFNFSSQALFALSSTLAVVIGFALKDIAVAVLAGISILINKPFQVGDRIAFAGFYGEVTDIGLRSVRLVTLDDNLVTIPSNKFLNEPVASANAGALDCMVVIPAYVTPDTDIKRAKEILSDAVLASRFLYLGKPFSVSTAVRLSNEGQVVVELNAKAYVYDARHEKAFASDVTEKTIVQFQREYICVPGSAATRVLPVANSST